MVKYFDLNNHSFQLRDELTYVVAHDGVTLLDRYHEGVQVTCEHKKCHNTSTGFRIYLETKKDAHYILKFIGKLSCGDTAYLYIEGRNPSCRLASRINIEPREFLDINIPFTAKSCHTWVGVIFPNSQEDYLLNIKTLCIEKEYKQHNKPSEKPKMHRRKNSCSDSDWNTSDESESDSEELYRQPCCDKPEPSCHNVPCAVPIKNAHCDTLAVNACVKVKNPVEIEIKKSVPIGVTGPVYTLTNHTCNYQNRPGFTPRCESLYYFVKDFKATSSYSTLTPIICTGSSNTVCIKTIAAQLTYEYEPLNITPLDLDKSPGTVTLVYSQNTPNPEPEIVLQVSNLSDWIAMSKMETTQVSPTKSIVTFTYQIDKVHCCDLTMGPSTTLSLMWTPEGTTACAYEDLKDYGIRLFYCRQNVFINIPPTLPPGTMEICNVRVGQLRFYTDDPGFVTIPIIWKTNYPSDSLIESSGILASDDLYTTDHCLNIRINCNNQLAINITSNSSTYGTATATAPYIIPPTCNLNPNITAVVPTPIIGSITFTWNTTLPSDTKVYWDLSGCPLNNSKVVPTLTTSHNISIGPLVSGQSYDVQLQSSTDGASSTTPITTYVAL